MSISIEGVDELIGRLGRVGAMAVLRRPMVRGLARVVAEMSEYPAQPAETDYVRTGTLGRRWTQEIDSTAEGLQGKAGNNTLYGPFVQSEMFQAEWMAHWQTDEDVVERQMAPIERDFQAAIDDELGE